MCVAIDFQDLGWGVLHIFWQVWPPRDFFLSLNRGGCSEFFKKKDCCVKRVFSSFRTVTRKLTARSAFLVPVSVSRVPW